jgi:hypothetical protein
MVMRVCAFLWLTLFVADNVLLRGVNSFPFATRLEMVESKSGY